MKPLSGGCQCRAIRYNAAGPAVFSLQCCCRQCQRITGGGHASQFAVPTDTFELAGQPAEFGLTADSGNAVVSAFCPRCGNPLFKRSTGHPQWVFVHAATLDDPSAYAPQRIVWHASAQPWDRLEPDLPRSP